MQITIRALVSVLVLAWGSSAFADLGPKPTMHFDFVRDGVGLKLKKAELLQCKSEACPEPAPLKELGPQRFECKADECFAMAYDFEDFHRLRVTLPDGRTLTSPVFRKEAFAATFRVELRGDVLNVTKHEPVDRRVQTVAFVFFPRGVSEDVHLKSGELLLCDNRRCKNPTVFAPAGRAKWRCSPDECRGGGAAIAGFVRLRGLFTDGKTRTGEPVEIKRRSDAFGAAVGPERLAVAPIPDAELQTPMQLVARVHTDVAVKRAQLLRCSDARCKKSTPLERTATQAVTCRRNVCSAHAPRLDGFFRLSVTLMDGKTRKSAAFEWKGRQMIFEARVGEKGITLSPENR